ncbi:Chaperone protein dnaJ C76, chloroplastic [Linum perenne]
MTSTACLPFYPSPASMVAKSCSFLSPQTPFYRKTLPQYPYVRICSRPPAASSSSAASSLITDFDLYDLLGIDSSSNQSQIKLAYRALQKRCHPDIAGPTGHDMAIVLNEAYSILSDPNSRLAYDKEQSKMAELRGYTGKPLYSSWMGSEREDRAVFVDEVKCVGCLKCALFAKKTFAIESVYGRARVVAQWADPEDKIQAAIDTCPVDCISFVERTDLAALEFLMSKQPRGNVRIGASNSAGVRVSNIFVDVKKFQNRVSNAINNQGSKEADLQREAKMSAIQAIRSLWLYWLAPINPASRNQHSLKLLPLPKASSSSSSSTTDQPDLKKLHEAAEARRRNATVGPTKTKDDEEYWVPSTQPIPSSPTRANSNKSSVRPKSKKVKYVTVEKERKRSLTIPVVVATVAAVLVHLQVGGKAVVGGLNEHIGGTVALDVVNSAWLQVSLAWMTWFLIGAAAVELGESIRSNKS